MKNDDKNLDNHDNLTKYGEHVCTQFAWLPLDKQKENAERFSKITNNDSNSQK